MADELNKDQKPSSDNPPDEKKIPPSDDQGGQGNHEGDQLPEKFKGKSAADIAKSYTELEKKLGTYKDYDENKTKLSQFMELAKVINSDPELKDRVLKSIDKQATPKKNDSDEGNKPHQSDDTTITVRNEVISTFRKDLGLNSLPDDERKTILDKVMSELCDLVDPKGKMGPAEVLDNIPLPMLRKYLDKGYRLATIDDEKEQSRVKGLLEAKKSSEAMFGSFYSSGVKSKGELTPKEKEVARRMGVSEEAYLKNKQELEQ